jgi:ankyrin repeat protein
MQYFVTILLSFLVIHSSNQAGIIKTKEDLKETNSDNPLMQAFYSDDLQSAEQLLKRLNDKLDMKEIILVATLEQGGKLMNKKVGLLLKYGACPTKQTAAQDSPLHTAASYNRSVAIQLLLKSVKNRQDAMGKNAWGQTFLDVLGAQAPESNVAQSKDCLAKMGYVIGA